MNECFYEKILKHFFFLKNIQRCNYKSSIFIYLLLNPIINVKSRSVQDVEELIVGQDTGSVCTELQTIHPAKLGVILLSVFKNCPFFSVIFFTLKQTTVKIKNDIFKVSTRIHFLSESSISKNSYSTAYTHTYIKINK